MPDYLSLHSREPACLLSKRNRYALPEACPHICVHGVYKLLSGDPCRFFFLCDKMWAAIIDGVYLSVACHSTISVGLFGLTTNSRATTTQTQLPTDRTLS